MNKKFYGTLLLGTLLLGSTIVSCKDYDDDIDNLQNQITQLATKADMQSEVSKLQSAVATAQAAAENKAAAAEQAAKDAAAKAQAAADAAAAAQGKADAAATVEALNQVAADAAAAAQAAEEAKAAAEAKAAELEAQLAELQALAATLVSTEDFEAAKKELNDKYAELAAKIGETTGVTGMTGINLVGADAIAAGYGVWAGVRENMRAAEWKGPKAETINAIEKGTKLAAWGAKDIKFSVNPTDFDASKIESFAVVNQFDEVAPIAFGTPKAVTRAAAGAWTLPVLGNVVYGEKAVEFEAKFSKKANNQDGSTATLVAGQFAGALNPGFCSVAKNENYSRSNGFIATVAYDEINGAVELGANDATKVLDAYITSINTGLSGAASKNAHDSIVYTLGYTGTTLTYNAAAVKKLLDDNAGHDKSIILNMKEINLNGYIHTSTGIIIFKAKEGAGKPIVLERIQLDKTPHTIVPILWNKSEGEDVKNQKVTVSILPALQEWGIDLSKTTDEATIHWNHTQFSSVVVDTVYYFDDDQNPVYLNKFADATLSGKEADKKYKADLTLEFKDNYTYENVKKPNNAVDKNSDGKIDNFEDGIDAAFNGKLIYVPVKMTGIDTDNGVAKTVEYSVVVPVQFNKINIQDYYEWNEGKAIKILNTNLGTTELSHLFKSTATTGNSSTDVISLEKPTFTAKDADGNNAAETGKETAYFAPSVTVSDQLTGDAYTTALAKMQEDGYTNETDKTSRETELARITTHAAYVIFGSSTHAYQGYLNLGTTSAPNNKWVVVSNNTRTAKATSAPTGIDEKFYFDITYPTGAPANVQKYITNAYKNLLINAKYTINGLTAKIMGRSNVPLGGLEVEVYSEETSAYTVELSDNRIFNDASSPVIYLANKFQPVVGDDAGKYNKTFAITDKYGTYYEVAGSLTGTLKYTIVFADGAKADASNISVTSDTYTIKEAEDQQSQPVKKYGLVIDVTGTGAAITGTVDGQTRTAKAGDKILITIDAANFKRMSDGTAPSKPITFEFEVAE